MKDVIVVVERYFPYSIFRKECLVVDESTDAVLFEGDHSICTGSDCTLEHLNT